ncbi:hypothetical protein EGR_09539 [Echinococcus granulosus]|uniref:Uncharacterized protein n=1 Tax=Echinococcus granulosus TaxID=6210 RepID=W6UQC8_ECHGR|nr:hypothetical protein EGR_09539 [Echinococcus granulosus]EUB55599.1 hypothetical protein EGR_09539 [Echinococcus granulosus]
MILQRRKLQIHQGNLEGSVVLRPSIFLFAWRLDDWDSGNACGIHETMDDEAGVSVHACA